MQKSYLSITYDISPRYVVNPLTGDRYFSGYEVKIIPDGETPPIPLGVFRNRRLATQKAKESIYCLREELIINTGLNPEQNHIVNLDGLLARVGLAFNQALQFLRHRLPFNQSPKDRSVKNSHLEAVRSQ